MSSYVTMVSDLARVRGVRAAVVAWEREGVCVESAAHVDVSVDVLTAFGCALYRRVRQAGAAARLGEARFLTLEAEAGRLSVIGRDDLVLVVLSEAHAATGQVRLAMQRAAERLV